MPSSCPFFVRQLETAERVTIINYNLRHGRVTKLNVYSRIYKILICCPSGIEFKWAIRDTSARGVLALDVSRRHSSLNRTPDTVTDGQVRLG